MTHLANEAALDAVCPMEPASSADDRNFTESGVQIAVRVVYILLSAVLIFAATMKTWQAASRPSPDVLLFGSKWWTLALVEWEVLLGLWLLSSRRAWLAWYVVTATFVVFASAALLKWVLGHESCGCFGQLEVPPWAMLLVDLTAISALVLIGRRVLPTDGIEGRYGEGPSIGRDDWIIGMASAGLLIGLPIVAAQAGNAASGGINAPLGGLVLLEPETWIGRPAPILEHIEIDSALTRGQWRLLLYHSGCSKCQEVLPLFILEAEAPIFSGTAPKFAIVEVDPHSRPELTLTTGNYLSGSLSDAYDWFVTTPVEITLIDGIVTSVRKEFDNNLATDGS